MANVKGDHAETLLEAIRMMMRHDAHAQALGICLLGADGACVRFSMRVLEEHLSFHRSCHGGVLFSLADTAFGMVANAEGNLAYGIDAHMYYSAAVKLHEELVAEVTEQCRSRKLATYRVDIRRPQGELVCGFTGTVYRTGRLIFPPAGEADGGGVNE